MRLKSLSLLAIVVLLSARPAFGVDSALRAAPTPVPRLGINLAGPVDWNTELPFIDVFRLARTWISQREGDGWGRGPQLALDEHGWVTRLESNCWAETPLCTIEGGHYPGGNYTVLYEGEGRIAFNGGGANIVSNIPGRIVVKMEAAKGGFFLQIRATNPQNYIRHIRVLMPGFSAGEVAMNPWHPKFLARWRGVACLRFMDFEDTNGSEQRQWKDRPQMDDATFTRNGVPAELWCDLANRLEADAWICIPHLADDAYVRALAALVRARLGPKRKVYVEYSNEVWNGQFAQNRYAGEQGMKLGIGDKPWEAAWHFNAQRSVEIFKIWEDAFAGTGRLVRVLASQAGNAYVAQQIVSWKDAWRHADALAIAPYITLIVPGEGKGLNASEVATWSVEHLLDYAETNALPDSIRWMQDNKKVGDQYGLKLVCYEAGQHFVGTQGGENNELLSNLLQAANAHPRMAEIYQRYYRAWDAAGGDLLCYFSSVSQWSKWGSWGLLQFADDDPKQSPKFMATMQWAASHGQPVMLPK